MSERLGADERAADPDALLGRWTAVTASARARRRPAREMLAAAGRRRATFRVAVALAGGAAAVVLAAGGAGLWLSIRGAVAASPSPTVVAAVTTPTPSPSPVASPRPVSSPSPVPWPSPAAISLAEHERIMRFDAADGWVVTSKRLLLREGSGWRECLRDDAGRLQVAGVRAVIRGSTVRALLGATLWTSDDRCSSWRSVELPAPAAGAAFPTDSIGYFVEYVEPTGYSQKARVFRTADGGAHWSVVATVVPPRSSLGRVFGGDLSLAFAGAEQGWLTDAQTLWRTADGGRTWNTVKLPVPAGVGGRADFLLPPAVAPDGSVAIVAKYDATPGMDGAKGQRVFYRSTDAGAHWTAASTVADGGMLSISLADTRTWVAFDAGSHSSFRSTSDAGQTWRTVERVAWPLQSGWFNALTSIAFADAGHGWLLVYEPEPPCAANVQCDRAFGAPQHLVATDDGGATWREILG